MSAVSDNYSADGSEEGVLVILVIPDVWMDWGGYRCSEGWRRGYKDTYICT